MTYRLDVSKIVKGLGVTEAAEWATTPGTEPALENEEFSPYGYVVDAGFEGDHAPDRAKIVMYHMGDFPKTADQLIDLRRKIIAALRPCTVVSAAPVRFEDNGEHANRYIAELVVEQKPPKGHREQMLADSLPDEGGSS